MPKFYFDSDDGRLAFQDQVGLDFPTRDHAQREAGRAIREMFLSHVPDLGSAAGTLSLTMRSDAGQALYKVSVNYTVEYED